MVDIFFFVCKSEKDIQHAPEKEKAREKKRNIRKERKREREKICLGVVVYHLQLKYLQTARNKTKLIPNYLHMQQAKT